MKNQLRNLFAPILNLFESEDTGCNYKSSRRTILKVVGILFVLLSMAVLAAGLSADQVGSFLPFLVFFCAGSVCLIVGFLGTDQAVAKIWGNK